jgi:hypothetical protein
MHDSTNKCKDKVAFLVMGIIVFGMVIVPLTLKLVDIQNSINDFNGIITVQVKGESK